MAISSMLGPLAGASLSTLALAGAGVLALVYLAQTFVVWWRLRHVPGPFWHSISKIPLVKMAAGGTGFKQYYETQKKYGKLVRMGPNQVMYADPDTVRLTSAARSEFVKAEWYGPGKTMKDQHNVFSMYEEPARTKLKAKVAPGYNGVGIGSFEPKIEENVGRFVDLIERKYLSTPTEFRPMDFGFKSQFFTLDVITDLGMGEAAGFLSTDSDLYKYMEIADSFMPFFPVIMHYPLLEKFIKGWPMSAFMPKDGDKTGLGVFIDLAKKTVAKRRAPDAEQGNDMLASHIRHGLNDGELTAEILLMLLAGSDTAAAAIRMTMLHLMTNPKAMSTLRKEIDDAIDAGKISSPVRDSEAQKLPYLQGVIKEGLRIYPPATGTFNRVVPKGGQELHGYYLPEGTEVLVNMPALGRDPIYGPDADVFRPERWIEAAKDPNPERLKEMTAVQDLIFGYGKYYCLGRPIALMEFNKLWIELFRRFDFSLVDSLHPMNIYDASFWVCHDFKLRVSKREDAH